MLDYGARLHHIWCMRKARISVGLDLPLKWWLTREAKRYGITIGELIRRILAEKRESK